jgi:hypothetical protein
LLYKINRWILLLLHIICLQLNGDCLSRFY